jgi:nicotinamidase-related amidase
VSTIIDLRETSPNHWQAKYQGNYGVYTIRINTDGKRRGNFSCSCPSDYYPCKHIPIIEKAIAERIAKSDGIRKSGTGSDISAEELLGKLTHKELYDFTAGLIRNNPDLTSAVFLEFSEKIENKDGNKYAPLIRRELENLQIDADDYYDEDYITIDVLDEWVEKAEQYLQEKKSSEAVLIAQAYIEEFADWLQETVDRDLIDWISDDYQSRPFGILEKAAADPQVDARKLYDYCMAEAPKERYSGLYMTDCFSDVLMKLAAEVNPEAFIDMQRKLLDGVGDRSSYEAEKIIRRIVDFYTNCRESKTAWQYVEDNIQIDSFRRMVVEKRIKQKKFSDAKKLIHDYRDAKQGKYRTDIWDDYLLQIARGEKDVPAIQSIAYSFIKDSFKDQYYRIYKSAFSAGEWPERFESLLRHYNSRNNFWSDSAADLLAAEGMAERLIEHIEKNISLEKMEKHYTCFVTAFPEKTLALFRTAVDRYAEEHTGRDHYEHIINVFKKMKKIPGGDAAVENMKRQYLVQYKKRRAMIEILNRK